MRGAYELVASVDVDVMSFRLDLYHELMRKNKGNALIGGLCACYSDAVTELVDVMN